jgi:hypothetical protein
MADVLPEVTNAAGTPTHAGGQLYVRLGLVLD